MPNHNHRLLAALISLAVALVSVDAAGAEPDANVAGTWAMTVISKMGTSKPTAILIQDGSRLTGTYKGRTGDVPITGIVSSHHVQLDIPIKIMGRELQLTYIGVVDGNMMSGTTKMAQMGEGAFTGKRVP